MEPERLHLRIEPERSSVTLATTGQSSPSTTVLLSSSQKAALASCASPGRSPGAAVPDESQPVRLWRCDECGKLHCPTVETVDVLVDERRMSTETFQIGRQAVALRICRSCYEEAVQRTRDEDPWDEHGNAMGASAEVVDAGR